MGVLRAWEEARRLEVRGKEGGGGVGERVERRVGLLLAATREDMVWRWRVWWDEPLFYVRVSLAGGFFLVA